MKQPSHAVPPPWAVALALALVYLPWGTTFLAIKVGVKEFPPALFGGTRICLAGLLLLGYLAARGQSIRISGRELLWLALVALFMFVGGNWLIGLAEKTEESGESAILAASMPLWLALLELVVPRGERLTWRGWLGLVLGLVGVGVMMRPEHGVFELVAERGRLLVVASAFCWAVGSCVLRHRPRGGASRLAAGAYQMVLGGLAMSLLGLSVGEAAEVTADKFTGPAVAAYFYLLAVGSLVGYLAYLWLLDHVSAALAGSYAYVSPVVALLVGWALGRETVTGPMLLGMAIILASVFLVRGGVRRPRPASADGGREL